MRVTRRCRSLRARLAPSLAPPSCNVPCRRRRRRRAYRCGCGLRCTAARRSNATQKCARWPTTTPRIANLYGPAGVEKTYVLVEAINRRGCEMRDGTVGEGAIDTPTGRPASPGPARGASTMRHASRRPGEPRPWRPPRGQMFTTKARGDPKGPGLVGPDVLARTGVRAGVRAGVSATR